MKGLILAGGAGTRLAADHAHERQAARPDRQQADHLLRRSSTWPAAGHQADRHRRRRRPGATRSAAAVGDGSRFGVEITYIPQDAPLGLAHCVLIARDFLGDDDFVMYLGDNMLQDEPAHVRRRVRRGAATASPSSARTIALPPVGADPARARRRPAAASASPSSTCDGDIVRLVEKPADPPSDLALVGVYLFTPPIHDAVRAIEPSARGELEITDAIQWLLDHGHRVRHEILAGLVDRHRQEGPAARVQPPRARHASSTASTAHVDERLARRRPRRDRGGRRADRLGRARARRSSAPAPGSSTPTSGRTRRSAPTASSSTPRSSTRSCSTTAASSACHRIQDSLLGREVEVRPHRAPPARDPARCSATTPASRPGVSDRVKLLVTGGAGFIGSNYVRHVLRATPTTR